MKQVEHVINEREVLRFLTLQQLNKNYSSQLQEQSQSLSILERLQLGYDRDACPYIIKIYSSFQDSENLYLELEYIEGCTLLNQIKKMNKSISNNMSFYAGEVLQTLEYLH